MRIHATALAVLASLALTAGTAAAPKRPEISISREATVGGVTLGEGAYRIEVAPALDAVTILRGRKEIVTVPARVTTLDGKAMGDSVYFRKLEDGTETITKILLVRPKLSIELLPAGTASARAGGPPARTHKE